MHYPQYQIQRCRKLAGQGKGVTGRLGIGALLGALVLGGLDARGQNILYNGDFETAGPAGWSSWASGGGAAYKYNDQGNSTHYVNAWGGTWGNSAGWYQNVSAVAGATYTLSVDSATENWWNPEGKMGLQFKDAAGNNLQNFELVVANYANSLPWSNYTLIATAPANSASVNVDLKFYGGGSVMFDNAVLQSSVSYPAIANVYPDGARLMQATNALHFTATSGATITNIQVVLNGVDVSTNLVVSGSPTSKSVAYNSLATNTAYAGTITIRDANNLSASVPVAFDTFDPIFLWEAEDFDYSGGLYINSPTLSSMAAAGSYFGVIGTQGIDENDIGNNGAELYRTNDFMSTGLAGDTPRQNFITAQLTDPNIQDYNVGYFDVGEWVNYTRDFPAGRYNIYIRAASGNSGVSTIYLDKVISGQGTSTQTTSPLGSFKYNGTSWSTYQYVPLTDDYDNLIAVDLSGVTTLRARAGAGNMNFFFIVPARLDIPVISGVYPSGTVLLQPTNKLVFTVSSTVATIPTNNIHLSINGVDVTSSLTIAGTSTSKSVSYAGLKTNVTYTAIINVADANGSAASTKVYFDTFNALFSWEAEDWDYSSGQYISDPVPTSASAANSYFGQIGVQGVDENETGTDPANAYRAGDSMYAGPCGDTPRQKFVDAQAADPSVADWNVGYFNAGEWVDYTRNFPAGTYNIYARLANGNGGTAAVYLQQVTSGRGTTSQGTLSLGSFQFSAQGWNAYSYVPLRDRFGNYAELSLSGVTTLRATAGGANMNFFMLTAARNDLPRISNVNPDGTLELQATNVFHFTASNPTVPIYSTNISVTLNGVDVTPQLDISGSVSGWDVSLPLALNVGRYAATIAVRDANTNETTTTIYFDTFNPTNFTWEAEDYDFTGGQFIDNPVPTSAAAANSYFGLDSSFGVDYCYETSDPATPYTYYQRYSLGIDYCGDYPPLARYVTAQLSDPSVRDFNLAYWTSNSWANYTRTYPAGTYNIYARMASGTGGNVQLDKLSGGATNHLGQFNLSNWGWGTYNWWPLVDTNGEQVTVTLGGKTTLRATTDGGANANRFMLVTPLAAVSRPQITATASSGDIVLSFPTQVGRVYQVWAKDNLADTTWSLMAVLSGDGAVKSWSQPITQAHRFYRLVIQ